MKPTLELNETEVSILYGAVSLLLEDEADLPGLEQLNAKLEVAYNYILLELDKAD